MFKQKKLSLGARFGLYIASFLLGILLFVTAITTALIANMQIVTSEENISGLIREMISAPAHIRPKAPIHAGEGGLRIATNTNRSYAMPRREEPSGVASDLTGQLIGMFYEEMVDQFDEEFPVSQEEFTQMINDSTVKDYIADKTASLITDYFNDEITTTFEPEEIVQLIKENSALIESITGEPIPDDIAQQVATVFDENEIIVKVEAEGLAGFMELLEGGNSASPEGDASEGADTEGQDSSFDIKTIVAALRQFASVQNLVIGIAICLVLIAAIVLINCRQIGKGLRRAGYPLMWAGCLVILNLLAKFQPDMWVITAGEGESVNQTLNLVLKLARHILLQTAVVNIVIFGTGLALCIAGIVLPIVLRAKRKTPVSIPASPETEELAAALVDETPVEFPCESADEAPVEEVCDEAPAEETVEEDSPEEETVEEAAPVGE